MGGHDAAVIQRRAGGKVKITKQRGISPATGDGRPSGIRETGSVGGISQPRGEENDRTRAGARGSALAPEGGWAGVGALAGGVLALAGGVSLLNPWSTLPVPPGATGRG
jgi:hypothetical protein